MASNDVMQDSELFLHWGNKKRNRFKRTTNTSIITRRGVGVGVGSSNNSKSKVGHYVWPKLYLGLSDKEKEEDFMAMKGCKLPQRPKKHPKAIQKSLILVCPGGWLADMYHDRYEIGEKKSSKKRLTGLKAMGRLESVSE